MTFHGKDLDWTKICGRVWASVGSAGFDFLGRRFGMRKKSSTKTAMNVGQSAWLKGYKGYVKRIKGEKPQRTTIRKAIER